MGHQLADSKAASEEQAGQEKPDPDTCRRLLTRLRRSKSGWVKAHMGILRNEAADVLAKNVVEGV